MSIIRGSIRGGGQEHQGQELQEEQQEGLQQEDQQEGLQEEQEQSVSPSKMTPKKRKATRATGLDEQAVP